jgi:membrane associated rhomboid family serine protease
MGAMIPLTDASRRPVHFPIITICIILTNLFVFVLELTGGDAFVLQWSAIPSQIVSGHHWITILTAMFMHGSWSHIIGNMIYLWAFGPEIEDAMGPLRYSVFYVLGGLVAMLAQVAANPSSTVPNLGASGAIAAVMGGFRSVLAAISGNVFLGNAVNDRPNSAPYARTGAHGTGSVRGVEDEVGQVASIAA